MTVLWTVIGILWALLVIVSIVDVVRRHLGAARTAAWVLLVIVSIVDVVRRHLGAARTAAWVLLLLIFPFVGVIVYWARRKPTGDEVERSVDAERDMRQGTPPPPGARLGS
jgi:hypothetical protein